MSKQQLKEPLTVQGSFNYQFTFNLDGSVEFKFQEGMETMLMVNTAANKQFKDIIIADSKITDKKKKMPRERRNVIANAVYATQLFMDDYSKKVYEVYLKESQKQENLSPIKSPVGLSVEEAKEQGNAKKLRRVK